VLALVLLLSLAVLVCKTSLIFATTMDYDRISNLILRRVR